jgi:hypothetical protein
MYAHVLEYETEAKVIMTEYTWFVHFVSFNQLFIILVKLAWPTQYDSFQTETKIG